MNILEKKELDSFVKSLKHMLEIQDEEKKRNIDYQYDIFNSLCSVLSSGEGLVFNTLFSKISYIGIKFHLKKDLLRDLHIYRKEYENAKEISRESLYDLGSYIIKELLHLAGLARSVKMKVPVHRPEITIARKEIVRKRIYGRYNLIGRINSEEYILVDDEDPTVELKMRTDNLEIFNSTIKYIDIKVDKGEVPVTVSLVYVDIDADGILMPQMIILQPDYLVDVTAVAECFKHYGGDVKYYLLNKYSPDSYSIHITTGNTVNFFLDEIVSKPEIEFKELIAEIFLIDPIRFTLLSDKELMALLKSLEVHFGNVKRVVNEDFRSIYLDPEKCILEPSFYSPVFGLQGRLDIFHQKVNSKETAIIELKSGKLFMPNAYGLNTNHYTQTLLYELLIRSAYNFSLKPINFILYSALDKNNIRFAPSISAQQKEAISVRNEIVALEQNIVSGKDSDLLFEMLNPENFGSATGFIGRDLDNIWSILKSMNATERAYFKHFASFIALEQQLAKTGYMREGINTGQSALWLIDEKQKAGQFSILTRLRIHGLSEGDSSVAQLFRTEESNELSNFRRGDIVLLYPHTNRKDKLIEGQVFKCTIMELLPDSIIVKLRAGIRNLLFESDKTLWNLEHDYLDTGFSKMHRGLIRFFGFQPEQRDLILTAAAPSKPNDKDQTPELVSGVTEKQMAMISRIVNCNDYFLLWGPPGTGKTSKIIRNVADILLRTNENIMLVAYTNRAVDELCDAVESICSDTQYEYLRIGSRFSCPEKYQARLLDNQARAMMTRAGLKQLLENTRIFISTVSSLQGKDEIFAVKKFDTIIVDEASQLLEPMIVPVLPQFRRFILVGDHMQLPAVVTQSSRTTSVRHPELNKSGLIDMSQSLFERMFRRAMENKWEWAYGMLDEQGRMHEDIMSFPNRFYYDGRLIAIPHIKRLVSESKMKTNNDVQHTLVSERMIYVPSAIHKSEVFAKYNNDEAQKISELIKEYTDILRINRIDLAEESIGIITTFRSQIATIRNQLIKDGRYSEKISIDTVERYQGSARDVIIYSVSVNSLPRFDQVLNPDIKGLDRKLNVVITRAREHFVFLGNEKILKQNKIYNQLINCSAKLEIKIVKDEI
jgi:DNA replication ATP-dependent helicase Dna2